MTKKRQMAEIERAIGRIHAIGGKGWQQLKRMVRSWEREVGARRAK